MTKVELIKEAATRTGLTQSDVKRVYETVNDVAKEQLKAGEDFPFGDLGIFKVREKNARKGRNPKNGEVIDIPAKTSLAFRPSSTIKAELND